MAYVTPITWDVDQLVTAEELNEQIRDNISALKTPPTDTVELDEASDYTTNSASWVDVGAALSLTLTTTGGDVMVGFMGTLVHTTGYRVYFNLEVDEADLVADDGICGLYVGTTPVLASFVYLVRGLAAGEHVILLRWKVEGGQVTLRTGQAGSGSDVHSQFWAKES